MHETILNFFAFLPNTMSLCQARDQDLVRVRKGHATSVLSTQSRLVRAKTMNALQKIRCGFEALARRRHRNDDQ